MLVNLLEYHWAEHIDDALLLLSRPDVKTVPLAGGTYLLGLPDETIQAVVDLRDLELAYITEEVQNIRIGAMTTLQTIADAPSFKDQTLSILARAAHASSFSRLIRNSATIGGTLGAGAASQADLHTALAVLDAEVILRSGSKSQVNLSGGTAERPGLALAGVTYKGMRERRVPYGSLNTERRANELITEVVISRPGAHSGSAFQRVGRTLTDVALLNAAALVEIADGIYQHVRVALGGVNMEPMRLHDLEQQLQGQPATAVQLQQALRAGMANFAPPSDFRASSGYRRVIGVNLAFRALEEATNVSHWRGVVSSEGGA
jgi:CO/xanthine dehydrogenase FAD-binding subunit